MSNKRNRRRLGQRIRSEIVRKIGRITKSTEAFLSSLAAERARKESERYWKKPTRAEARWREKLVRRWHLGKPRRVRKPRTNIKRWLPSHDLDN